jgi:asparagine synthase (glutamine-hydrolysing)
VSGIAGVVRFDGAPVLPSDVDRMIGAIAHRGPDGIDTWINGSVGLANGMLRTTPESVEERLPLVEDGLVVVADARIDNRIALTGSLGLPSSVPDSRVILAAYRRWRDRCPERLIGDFAFAIWDERRRTLLLARDHMGVRPLVWFRSGSLFAFASQERALLALPEVPSKPDEIAIADVLVASLEDTERTLYDGIRRLPPHHALSVSMHHGIVRSRSYWQLDASRELRLRSDRDYEDRFRATFLEAVRARTRSIGPVATELSGGLDSAAVTCATRDLREGPLDAFSIVFDEPGSDERRFVDTVVASGGIRSTKIVVDELLALRLDDLLEPQDGPFASLTVVMETALIAAAASSGCRVLLGGFDGDVVVSHGLERLPHLLRRGRVGTLRSEVSAVAPRLGLSTWEAWRSYVLAPVAPAFAQRLWSAYHGQDGHGWASWAPIDPAFARRVGLPARLASLSRRSASSREEHRDQLASGVLPSALEIRDRIGAAAGVELRHPFFDVRLVELCLAMPDGQKMRNGWTRSIQRRALAGIVPDEILRRTDKGRMNDALFVGLVEAQREILDGLDGSDWGEAGRFLSLPMLRSARASNDRGELAGLWQGLALARWLAIGTKAGSGIMPA